MTNYKKIKTILNYGHRVKVTLVDDKIIVFNHIRNSSGLRGSDDYDSLEEALNYIGEYYYFSKEKINILKIKSIEPLPKRYKVLEEGDKVDILPIAKEIDSYDEWYEKKQDMVGQKGLEIKDVFDNSYGTYYWIYTKNKYCYCFPAYAVSPHIEDETDEK